MALTAINNACRFSALLCLFLVPKQSTTFVGKLHITFKNILTNDLGRKRKFTLTLFLSFFIGINSDLAGIYSTVLDILDSGLGEGDHEVL